jgi:hypothetical protein
VEVAGASRHGRWDGFGRLFIERCPGRSPWSGWWRRSSPGGAMTGMKVQRQRVLVVVVDTLDLDLGVS